MLLRSGWSQRVLDLPVRSNAMHSVPVSRMGGLGMACAVIPAALALSFGPTANTILLSACALLVLSFFDDRAGLPVSLRLAAHLAAAAVAVCALLGTGEFTSLKAILLILAIAWMTNVFNFMDGADGIAGGMALIGFGALALGADSLAPLTSLTLVAAALSGAALGFLCFNFSPARIFLGDAGSIPLGFLAATLGLQGWSDGRWPWWFPVLAFSPFIVDASATLVRRAWNREVLWRAHRGHYYQRLILSGWSHRKTALAAYLLMLAVAVSAIVATRLPAYGGTVLYGWVVLYGLLLMVLEWRLRTNNNDKTKTHEETI